MPVETAADLAGMFGEDEFAEPASYTPPGGGASLPCSVIVDRGQGREDYRAGRSEIVTSERKLWAQLAEIAVLARDGTFAMLDASGVPTGEAFKVAGDPKLDHLAALWSADLLIVE